MEKFFNLKIFLVLLLTAVAASVGFLVWKHSLSLKTPNFSIGKPATLGLNLMPVTQEHTTVTLNLSSPDNDKLVYDNNLLIEGQATPNAVVILSTNNNDQVLNVTNKGDFSVTLKLKNGLNQFTVAAFDKLGNTESESRTVYYSSETLQ